MLLPTRSWLPAIPMNAMMTAYSRRCSSAIPVPKPLHLLLYTYTDNALEKRAPHRSAHLAAARAAEERGQLLLGGALADPLDGGVLLFAGGKEVAEAFATSDPYTQNGIVTDWTVREWTVVAGSLFAQLPALPPFVPTYEWQAELHHGQFDQAELPAGLEISLPLDGSPRRARIPEAWQLCVWVGDERGFWRFNAVTRATPVSELRQHAADHLGLTLTLTLNPNPSPSPNPN